MSAANSPEHRRRHFSGVSAFLFPEHVLATDRDLAVLNCFYRGRQTYKWRAEYNLVPAVLPNERKERCDKLLCLFRRLVHLPVGCDQFLSHEVVSVRISKWGNRVLRSAAARVYAWCVRRSNRTNRASVTGLS